MMYFQSSGLQKTLLNQSRKSPASEDPSKRIMVNASMVNTEKIWTRAPLSYLLITVKAIDLQKASVSDRHNHKHVC